MRHLTLFVLILALALGAGVNAQTDEMDALTTFTVRIENVSGIAHYENTGVFAVPEGASEPGPVLPGGAIAFEVEAQPGDYLSFATMFVESNDLFFAPGENGLALFDDAGNPVSGDVTDQISLWDAGTEINEELLAGENQALRQAAPNTGEAEHGNVQLASELGDGMAYPQASEIINVTLAPGMSDGAISVRIANISDSSMYQTPLTPGVWVVHGAGDAPLFSAGQHDRHEGLEALAEDGNFGILAAVLSGAGLETPLTPGVWVVHNEMAAPLFTVGEADRGVGLEHLAEDGNPADLAASVTAEFEASGVFAMPLGMSEAGPLLPGDAYEFTIDASPGARLSFASMFVQSNDLFFAPGDHGIALFDDMGTPISGNVTDHINLWDAGTEVNQEPGTGADQAPRQSGPNSGASENGVVQSVFESGDGFSYSFVPSIIRVTITTDGMDMMGG